MELLCYLLSTAVIGVIVAIYCFMYSGGDSKDYKKMKSNQASIRSMSYILGTVGILCGIAFGAMVMHGHALVTAPNPEA